MVFNSNRKEILNTQYQKNHTFNIEKPFCKLLLCTILCFQNLLAKPFKSVCLNIFLSVFEYTS